MPGIYYPSERVCPPTLLADLRRIEPTAELLYVGEGRWVLGTVRHYWPNIVKATLALAKLYRTTATSLVAIAASYAEVNADPARRRAAGATQARNIYYLRALMQGFRPIADYYGDPGGFIVRDFERRDWLYRNQPHADDAAKEAEALGDTSRATKVGLLRQLLHDTGRKGFRQAVRGLTPFFTNGLRGSAA